MKPSPGMSHVAVTVTDLQTSAEWYGRLFDTKPVLDEDTGTYYHIVFALQGGALFGLHGHPGSAAGDRFDELHVGLDHVAFACADRAEL